MKLKIVFLILFLISASSYSLWAAVAIETQVSQNRVSLGEELALDIIISDADANVSRPVVASIDGFTSYSQGHSTQISIINGRKSSKNIFSYLLVANSVGVKTIGPFEVKIGDRNYKIAPVRVEVVQDANSSSSQTSQPSTTYSTVYTPPSRAIPSSSKVSGQDVFVKAWLDKDEVVLNEPAILTYTLYTRMPLTYKGFGKEPETTGFWVEDFPPEKTLQKTEQFFNGQRYVVADVRKMAIFPTQVGVFTIDPGTLNVMVEVRGDDDFDSFYSSNVFGRRSTFTPFLSQMIQKTLPTDKLTLTAKELPSGKPSNFSGAVGQYSIQSTVDKTDAQVGSAITYRLKISGEGNINTIQVPPFPKLEDFKVYDSSTSTNISKERLKVEGEKIIETVIVPKKAGVFSIPAQLFSFYDPIAKEYRQIKSNAHVLSIKPGNVGTENTASSSSNGVEPAEQEDVNFLSKDIRYIRQSDDRKFARGNHLYQKPTYWIFNGLLFLMAAFLGILANLKNNNSLLAVFSNPRQSQSVAKARLKAASRSIKSQNSEVFYSEISKAIHEYFADKLKTSPQSVTADFIEEKFSETLSPEVLNKIKGLFNELGVGRFGSNGSSDEHMQKVYQAADEVINLIEKAKHK